MDAKLVVVGGEAKSAEIKLKLPTVIGRGREASLMLPHPLVSRQHCEIFESQGHLCVRDMGSLNGTFVGNERIADVVQLPPGELLTVGTVTFRVVYGDGDDTEHPASTTVAGGKTVANAPQGSTEFGATVSEQAATNEVAFEEVEEVDVEEVEAVEVEAVEDVEDVEDVEPVDVEEVEDVDVEEVEAVEVEVEVDDDEDDDDPLMPPTKQPPPAASSSGDSSTVAGETASPEEETAQPQSQQKPQPQQKPESKSGSKSEPKIGPVDDEEDAPDVSSDDDDLNAFLKGLK